MSEPQESLMMEINRRLKEMEEQSTKRSLFVDIDCSAFDGLERYATEKGLTLDEATNNAVSLFVRLLEVLEIMEVKL